MEAIKRLVVPTRNRKLIVEVLTGALNFKVYLEDLEVVVTGLVPNPRAGQMQTSHCWRFVRRMESWFVIPLGAHVIQGKVEYKN